MHLTNCVPIDSPHTTLLFFNNVELTICLKQKSATYGPCLYMTTSFYTSKEWVYIFKL